MTLSLTYESIHKYHMAIAHAVSTASACQAQKVGAIIVSPDLNVVATGYNQILRNCEELKSCYDGSENCMVSSNPSLAVHAEISAIAAAATEGVSIRNCSIYVTKVPCLNCLKAIAASGITALYLPEEHSDDLPNTGDRSTETFAYRQYLELVPVYFC